MIQKVLELYSESFVVFAVITICLVLLVLIEKKINSQ